MVISSTMCGIVILLLLGVYFTEGYQSAEGMSPSVGVNNTKSWEENPLLPTDTVPYKYNLYLHPDLQKGIFNGTVEIKVDITKPRSHILLHSQELDITKSEIINENGSKIEIANAFPYTTNQFWVIVLKESIVPGKYEIRLDFNGTLTGKIVGFYRSTYMAEDGSKRHIVTTKFEPTYARKAFPCFDEPRYKAEFVVHIVRPSGDNYFALSNMNQVAEESDTPSVGLTKVSFAPTPPMSTYLACFIVCDFKTLGPVYTKQGTPITVYARPGQENKTEFSRSVAQKVMNYFTDYFGIEYPLPKIDLIGVPDFVSGAMENWGLITFRETRIITSPDDSVSDIGNTATTVAHELAHMWFGDLVTMEWWDDLWLNEGFATFLSHQVVDIIEKDLFSTTDFVIGRLQPVLDDDAVDASHPIIQPVNHPDQITEIFDVISYSKGSAVLRMFESYAPRSFQVAVTEYLNKYRFKNALTVNLWTEMERAYGIPNMTRLMNTWTQQKGFPLITVQREDDKVILKQRRYLSDSSTTFDPNDSPFNYKWDIPIVYTTSKSPTNMSHLIFNLDNDETTIPLEKDVEWFKMNSQQNGFYRVSYSADIWLSFLPLLQSQTITIPEDRANLLDDAFALANGGYHSYEIPFKLVNYLKSGDERHYAPWVVASKYMNRYKNLLYGTPSFDKLIEFGRSLLSTTVGDDIWEVKNNASNLEKVFKSTLLSFACRMEIPQVVAKANEIFESWIKGKISKPDSSIRGLIYKYGVRGPNEAANRQKLWELYLKETDPNEKSDFMSAIASVSNPEMMAKLLELMKDEDNVRSQDYFLFIFYMCQTPEGGAFIWNYLRENWNYYVKRFTLNDRSFGVVIPKATIYFSTQEKLKEVEDFIKKNPEAGAGSAGRRKALESIRNNIQWREKHYKNIEETLNSIVK